MEWFKIAHCDKMLGRPCEAPKPAPDGIIPGEDLEDEATEETKDG